MKRVKFFKKMALLSLSIVTLGSMYGCASASSSVSSSEIHPKVKFLNLNNIHVNRSIANLPLIDFIKSINPNFVEKKDKYYLGYINDLQKLPSLFKEYCYLNNGVFFGLPVINYNDFNALTKRVNIKEFVDKELQAIKQFQHKYLLPSDFIHIYTKYYLHIPSKIDKNTANLMIQRAIYSHNYSYNQQYKRAMDYLDNFLDKDDWLFICSGNQKQFILGISGISPSSYPRAFLLNNNNIYVKNAIEAIDDTIILPIKKLLKASETEVYSYIKHRMKKDLSGEIIANPGECRNFIEYAIYITNNTQRLDNSRLLQSEVFKGWYGSDHNMLIRFKNKTNHPITMRIFNNLLLKINNATYAVVYYKNFKTHGNIDLVKDPNNNNNYELVINPGSSGDFLIKAKVPSLDFQALKSGTPGELVVNSCSMPFKIIK